MNPQDAIDKFGQHTNTCIVCRMNLFDLCPEGIELMLAAVPNPIADEHIAAAYDFEHPEEVAKRALCAKEGHLTKDHLGTIEATHGTKWVCVRCGRFWHNEPVPPEIKP